HARAAQSERIRDAVRDDAVERARQCAARYARRVRVLEMLVVVVVAREEHARRAVAQRVDRDARILDGLARDLERDPLLRIHPLGLTRRYVEVRGVKAADVLEAASPFRGDTAGRRG